MDYVVTEDGVRVSLGAQVFNYYDMKLGILEKFAGKLPDPWFDVKHEDGSISVLNGQRLCSVEFAQKRGWL